MDSKSYHSRKSTELIEYLQGNIRSGIPDFLHYFSTSHREGKKLFYDANLMENSLIFLLYVDGFDFFTLLDVASELIKSLGKVYKVLDKKSKHLLLRAMIQNVNFDDLTKNGWDLSHILYRSAQNTNRDKNGSITELSKPQHPPSKQRLIYSVILFFMLSQVPLCMSGSSVSGGFVGTH